ncbi:uncharacterized protein LTR77_007132 [Saxophila tyrrhenica]|uniref:Uncharacterized protein n=1 Tax=Saxophila tyrrhenica TaxID=1690608 RepID=A0AAV9P4L2_9PEZI|nr:hypothetical protein LTR77_007132 [Saxophila tyrrhenica]
MAHSLPRLQSNLHSPKYTITSSSGTMSNGLPTGTSAPSAPPAPAPGNNQTGQAGVFPAAGAPATAFTIPPTGLTDAQIFADSLANLSDLRMLQIAITHTNKEILDVWNAQHPESAKLTDQSVSRRITHATDYWKTQGVIRAVVRAELERLKNANGTTARKNATTGTVRHRPRANNQPAPPPTQPAAAPAPAPVTGTGGLDQVQQAGQGGVDDSDGPDGDDDPAQDLEDLLAEADPQGPAVPPTIEQNPWAPSVGYLAGQPGYVPGFRAYNADGSQILGPADAPVQPQADAEAAEDAERGFGGGEGSEAFGLERNTMLNI